MPTAHEYRDRYCAFVDILGFRQLIEQLRTSTASFEALHNLLKRIHGANSGAAIDMDSTDFRAQSISDAVAISTTVSAVVSHEMARQAPPELLGIHVNLPGTVPLDVAKALQAGGPPPSGLSADEIRAYGQLSLSFSKRRAYALIMGTRPQTLCGLADSPAGMAAWLLDHGDGYGQPASAIMSAVLGRTSDPHASADLTRDDVLDDITLYWLTNTAVSAGRLYWENKVNLYNAANISIPAAVTVFPGESYQAPRSWTEQAYHKLIYFNEAEKGGHFAAWEQPAIFSAEVRTAFRPLRQPT